MASLVQRFVEAPHQCPYLPEQSAALEVAVMLGVTPDELETLLERGWRRFGPAYFRPACDACSACLPVRVPVRSFVASRSQKRARRVASHLTRTLAIPAVDDERLALYAKWHRQREAARGWAESPIDARQYSMDFAFEHPSVREVSFRDPAHDNLLVGLGLVDQTPHALSAIYFFWDPEHAPPSLGVAHIVGLVEDAAALGLDHVHLGFRVDRCASLAYKSRYQPQEGLRGRPDITERPSWNPAPAVVEAST